MTIFVVIAAVMAIVAVGFVARPLLRRTDTPNGPAGARSAFGTVVPVAIALPLGAALLYVLFSNYDWRGTGQDAHVAGDNSNIEQMLAQLEQRLAEQPDDVRGWLLLGRSYAAIGRFPRAVEAYQKAYDLTGGEDLDAATGLAESLALVDEASLSGRAGQIFEQVLERAPDQPKALWYGAVMALKADNLPLARDRMQRLLAQNPPEQIRGILEQQIADISTQLGEAPPPAVSDGTRVASNTGEEGGAAPSTGGSAPGPAGAVRVDVTLDPQLAARLDGPRALFILARAAGGGGGPPLAVVRHTTAELPLTVELSDANAMIAGRTISSAGRVEILARVSTSGMPTQQSGDLVGSATYDVATGNGQVAIVIDQAVP